VFWSCEETIDPDTTPPQINIASPIDGATVSDTVVIKTIVADNDAIKSVEFFIDGDLLDSVSEEPYQTDWNTKEFSNGDHTIQCKAIDNSENKTLSENIQVTVTNPIQLPSVLPIFSNPSWVYETYHYSSETDYLNDENSEITYDTLQIFETETEILIYQWKNNVYQSLLINNNDFLLNIALVNGSDTTIYDPADIWYAYDEDFDCSNNTSPYYCSVINSYTTIDTIFGVPYYTSVSESYMEGLGYMYSRINTLGWTELGWQWNEFDPNIFIRWKMIEKIE